MNAKRILIVKTSSLGDVVHNFPMVSDIHNQFPNHKIDWVVEEAFASLVSLHCGVDQVIPVAIRRWRKNIFDRSTWLEIRSFLHLLRRHHYDVVIDSQGLLKSALIAKIAKGRTYGFDIRSAREWLAGLFYDIGIASNKMEHMMERCRMLAAHSMSYSIPSRRNFGLNLSREKIKNEKLAVILCSSAQTQKLWSVKNWISVCKHLKKSGIHCQFTWGNHMDRVICEQIQEKSGGTILPKMEIDKISELLKTAKFVIGLDTGIIHLAAAIETPVLAIFGASDPDRTRPIGNGVISVCGTSNAFPSGEAVAKEIDKLLEAIS